MKQLLRDLKNLFLNTIFPIACLICDRDGQWICVDCECSLTKADTQRCVVCQKPSLLGLTHPKCQAPHAPDVLWSLYDYHDARVAKSIVQAKYHFLPGVFSEIGEHLGENLIKTFPNLEDAVIVPIPLKASRQRWRGFNQAELIANAMSGVMILPTTQALVRQKSTKVQKDLGKEERKLNVRNAFALSGKSKTWKERLMNIMFEKRDDPREEISIQDKTILLVDDVVTTGSTLLEATKVLKRNGARVVYCITLAQD